MSSKIRKTIKDIEEKLEVQFPNSANYGSKASLWGDGLNASIVSHESYEIAKNYYGTLWNYVGD